jgi:hypothetical protein
VPQVALIAAETVKPLFCIERGLRGSYPRWLRVQRVRETCRRFTVFARLWVLGYCPLYQILNFLIGYIRLIHRAQLRKNCFCYQT